MQNFPLTPFFDGLIDDFGIWQHTDGANIVRDDGYSLGSAAKGLIFTLALNRIELSEVLLSYILKSKNQSLFYCFADQNKNFVQTFASAEVIGQVIWASGYSISKNFHLNDITQVIVDASVDLDRKQSMLGYAYALMGAVYVSRDFSRHYYEKLKAYFVDIDEFWPWPEPIVTSGSGIVAYAFLRYGLVCDNQEAVNMGQKILDFLEERCTFERQRGPIGSSDWLKRGANNIPAYSQFPSEASAMAWAWLASYQTTANNNFKEHAKYWMNWFEGENIIRAKMYNPDDLRCFDSIEDWGINYNSSSESNACFLLGKYMVEQGITI